MRITIEVKHHERQVFIKDGYYTIASGEVLEVSLLDAVGGVIYSETSPTMDLACDRAADFREAIDQPGTALIITPVRALSMEVGT